MYKTILLRQNNRKIVKNITVISGISLILLLFSFTEVNVRDNKIRTIVIDAGHGGKDSGTSGSFSKEKDITLSIAMELGKTIEKYIDDVNIIYTRDDDSFPSLNERANLANDKNADLFISIHCNSAPYSTTVHGTETYVMGLNKSETNLEVAKRENSVILMEDDYKENYDGYDPNSPESMILFSLYQNAYLENSLKLAQSIENQFKTRVGRKSRGVKQAPFVVLWKTSMPSILVETGFLTNKNEEKYLNDELGKTYIAHGIFRAVRDYKLEVESQN